MQQGITEDADEQRPDRSRTQSGQFHLNTNLIAPKTMPSTYDHAGNTRYDEVNDVYPTPTDAERLAWVEGQVKELWRVVGAVNYPNQRGSGGAVDSQIMMGWPGPRQVGK